MLSNYKFTLFAITIACTLATTNARAQRTYLQVDTTIYTGVKFIHGNRFKNVESITVKMGTEWKKYTPLTASEYRLKDGRVYRSIEVPGSSRTLFFEQLSKGQYDVYYLPLRFAGTRFFVKTPADSQLIALPKSKRAFVSTVREHVQDCKQSVKNTRHLRMTRNSIARFYNDFEKCSDSYLPRTHFGITFGTAYAKFRKKYAYPPFTQATYYRNAEQFLGVFAEIPFRKTNVSVATEITISHYDVSSFFDYDNEYYGITLDGYRVTIPILFRYTFLNSSTSPFFQVGPMLGRNVRTKAVEYIYQSVGSDVFITLTNPKLIAPTQLGITGGMGFILLQNQEASLMFQCKFNKYYVTNEQLGQLKSNEIAFGVGFIF